MKLVGRENEQKLFSSFLQGNQSYFAALYGRRRIGKTFLIREFFKNNGPFLEVVGVKDGTLEEQLEIFRTSFQKTFYADIPIARPSTWREAFLLLDQELDRQKNKRCIVFLDELPWLASPKSGLLEQLDFFWNTSWSQKKNLILIVCGSAASWIIDNIVNAKGGLHNRLTHSIKLLPFTLAETRLYLHTLQIKLDDHQILQLYMALGGVPYYLSLVKKGRSAVQNINDLFFNQSSVLFDEFNKLFASLFGKPDIYHKIVKEIGKHHEGISRETLLKGLGIKTGGRVHHRLMELEEAGFVASFTPFGKKTDPVFRLTDEYSLFYLKWLATKRDKVLLSGHQNHWLKKSATPEYSIWAGYSFENICLKHAHKIAKAIGIDSIAYDTATWRATPNRSNATRGAQIDLLFDRHDNTISVCEIKCSKGPFVIDKETALELIRKIDIFKSVTKTKKQVFLTLITPFGVKKNAWSVELVHNEVVLGELFK